MPRTVRRAGRAVAGLLLLLTLALAVGSAHADTTAPPPPPADTFTTDQVRAMTWNVCADAGGVRGSSGFCPYRQQPQAKADAIAAVAQARNLNTVLLQEACYTAVTRDDPTGTNPGKSLTDLVKDRLGAEWTFTGAEVMRPAAAGYDGKPHSYCRDGLPGTLGVVVGVKGAVDPAAVAVTTLPGVAGGKRMPLICLRPTGWATTVCSTHLSNDTGDDHAAEVAAVRTELAKYPSVVLGGDLNTRDKAKLAPLYGAYAECDQQAKYPEDRTDQPTHDAFSSPNTVPGSGGPLYAGPGGVHTQAKLDYLFASAGFAGCDVWNQLADHTDNYATGGEPDGFSDHAPLVGAVRGRAVLAWSLADAAGSTTAADGSGGGRPGKVTGSVTFADGAATFAGPAGAGAVTTAKPVVETSKSFTVAGWVKLDAGAASGAVVSQDGVRTSGFGLWFNQGDNTWRFSKQKLDADGWNPDQAVSPSTGPLAPQRGVWTHLAGVFDAGSSTLQLYVNGVQAAVRPHTALWNATGGLAVGRDRNNGAPGDFLAGAVGAVSVFDHPLTPAGVSALAAAAPQQPTGTNTVPGSDPRGPGCDQNGGYGTVPSGTPELTARIRSADPTAAVRASFSLWNNTHPGQLLQLGGPDSYSSWVAGGGTVRVPVPTALTAGDSYGWYVRTEDATGRVSAVSPKCHFVAG